MAKRSVPVRMDDEDKARWMEAAEKDGLSFAAWLRNACNAYCGPKETAATDIVAVDVPIRPKEKPTGVKAEYEDTGGFKIPIDAVKSRAERLGLDKKPKSASELFGHMLPNEE